jgi:hypothetical protein
MTALRYHDFHLRGYSVSDHGQSIELDLVYDYPDEPVECSRITFSGVASYSFVHTDGAIITNILEVPVASLVADEESFFTENSTLYGVRFWQSDLAHYVTTLQERGFRAWEIISAMGFHGFVIAETIHGRIDTLFARETPFALTGQPTLGAGVRNFSSTFRWNQQAYPLMVGSRGDTFSYFQVRQRTGGPIPYRSILAAGTAIAPDMANGTNTSVGVTLTEPPTVGADVRLDFPAYERALKEPRPSLPILLSAFTVTYRRGLPRVGVVTQRNRRIEAGLMVVAALGLPPGQPLAEGRFEWADVFPRDELVASVVTRGDVVISNGIATDTFNLFYERSVPLTGNTATLDATLSPVRDLSVGGQRAVAPLRGVGLTPVLSWSPPAQGTPTRYAVTLFDLVDQNYSAAFFTTKTQLELPPFTLTAGRTYVAIVTAERGAYDLLRPTFRPADSERVAAITDSFTP